MIPGKLGLMLMKVVLTDPGMKPLTVTTTSYDRVMELLQEFNKTFVRATVTKNGVTVMTARRKLSERTWNCKFISDAAIPESKREILTEIKPAPKYGPGDQVPMGDGFISWERLMSE